MSSMGSCDFKFKQKNVFSDSNLGVAGEAWLHAPPGKAYILFFVSKTLYLMINLAQKIWEKLVLL